ncbi:MAG: hypothetical protein QM674_22420 [Burkholderiaceae bacterium]
MRQWVLSLPMELRLLLAARPELMTPVLQEVQRALLGYLREQAGPGRHASAGHGCSRESSTSTCGTARSAAAQSSRSSRPSWIGR